MKKLIFAVGVLIVFASLQTWSQSESRQRYHFPSDNPDQEIYLLDRLILFNKGYKRALADHGGENIKSMYDDNNTDFVNRMIKLKEKIKTRAQKEGFNELIARSGQLDSELAKDISAGRTRTAPVAEPVVFTKKITCITGAFPIEYKPCSPVIVLAEDYGLAELNEVAASFNCENPKQMCNPFMTGFREDCFIDPATRSRKCVPVPVCVTGEGNTTVSCLKASDKVSSKKKIIELWKNPKNKMAYDHVKKALDEFCKPESVSGQTKISCQALQERFNEIRAKAWPSTGQPPAATEPARR